MTRLLTNMFIIKRPGDSDSYRETSTFNISRNSGVGDIGRTGVGEGRERGKKKALTLRSLSGLIYLSSAKPAH